MTICNKIIPVGLQGTLDSSFYWLSGSDYISNQQHIDYIVSVGGTISGADQATFDALPCIVPDGGSEAYPQWLFKSISSSLMAVDTQITLKFEGCYFSPNMVVTAEDLAVSNFTFNCDDDVTVDLDSTGVSLGVKKIYLDGIDVGTVEVIANTWIDFRTGGNAVDTLQYELIGGVLAGDVTRDANGIGLTTGTGWARAFGMPEFFVPANTSSGCQIVLYKPTAGAGMFGAFGDGHGTDTAMYNDMHMGGYFTSATTWWGFFAYASQANSQSISAYDRIKLKFPSTLTPGSPFEVWGLETADDFGGGTLLYAANMPSGTQATSTNVYPCLVPNNAITMRLQAFNTIGGA